MCQGGRPEASQGAVIADIETGAGSAYESEHADGLRAVANAHRTTHGQTWALTLDQSHRLHELASTPAP